MDLNFLTLDNTPISKLKYNTEYDSKIKEFLMDIYNLRLNIKKNGYDIVEKNKAMMDKLKLTIDVMNIYNNKDILRLAKEYNDEKKKEEEMKENLRNQRDNNNFNTFDFLNTNWSSFNSSSSDEDEKLDSDISEDEYEQENYLDMLDKSYKNIENKSTIQKILIIKREYIAQYDDDNHVNSDDDIESF